MLDWMIELMMPLSKPIAVAKGMQTTLGVSALLIAAALVIAIGIGAKRQLQLAKACSE